MLLQKTLIQEHKLKLRWFVAISSLPLLGVVTAFGIMPQTQISSLPKNRVVEDVALPQTMPLVSSADTFWHDERVQQGDTVDELLRRLEVKDALASEYLRKNPAAESLRKLVAGKSVQAETAEDGSLLKLRYLNGDGAQVVISRRPGSDGSFQADILSPQLEHHLVMRTGEIKTTLFDATDEAGLSDETASQMVEIFGGDIDFHRDLRKGDKFAVTYEETYINGEPVQTGRIQSAEFTNQGKTYRAVYFQSDSRHGDYYTPSGKSVRKAFLRSPVEFSRISSGFTSARFHPILQKWRAHKGVDYAAPIGTRVKVTADGVVAFVGQQGGYGNVIMVEHQGHYTTVYGHLSRFAKGLHRGERVAQGELIGYVGMTGWATGPHLHYEFRVNGEQRDPLRVALPNADPVKSSQQAEFNEATQGQIEHLNLLASAGQTGH